MQVLCVNSLLKTRVVLLNLVTMNEISRKVMVQKEGKVRVQIEQRTAHKAIDFQNAAVREVPLVVRSKSTEANLPPIEWINETEPIQLTRANQIKRYLTRGIEVIAPKIQLKAKRFLPVQMSSVVTRDVVAVISSGINERPIGVRAIVGYKGICFFQCRTVGNKTVVCVE